MGELAAGDASTLVAAFEADYFGSEREAPRFAAIAILPRVLDQAAEFAAVDALRAYDAVQLASATSAREADAQCLAFACFDDALRTAAAARGFTPIPS